MKIFKKILKWMGLTLASLVTLIILAGLTSRLIAPKPEPPGKLVDIGDLVLHIHAVGEKNSKPTLVIEAGAGAPSEFYHWLGEGLKDSIRVVRYDRAGIGYSELSETPRNPETTARELHTLLEKAGESPPYILAGHSYGGHYIRVFKELFPQEVAALVFLDSGHPDEAERLELPPTPGFLNTVYRIAAVLGDLGVLNLYFQQTERHILWAPGLPEKVMASYDDYTLNGKYLRGYLKEEKNYDRLLTLSKNAMENDTLPIRVFSGTHLNEKVLRERGFDPEKIRAERAKMQHEMAASSKNGKVVFLDGGHITIFSEKENADIICKEILDFLAEL